MKKTKAILLGLLLVISVGILTACGSKAPASGEANNIRLGINGDETEVWTYIKDELAKEDVDLEIISFSDFTRPNLSLSEGEIDVNAFQHYAFFDKFVAEHNLDLTVIGETVSAPIGLYSNKIKSLDELKPGDKVSIPSDATNGGRVLILFQTAGLIKVDSSSGNLPTLKEITENPLNLEFIEIEAGTSVRMLDDVALGSVNSVFAVDAGLDPNKDALFLESLDESTKPYVNIVVTRTEDKDNPLYKKVVELYRTDEVKEIVNRIYKGAQVPTW